MIEVCVKNIKKDMKIKKNECVKWFLVNFICVVFNMSIIVSLLSDIWYVSLCIFIL